MKIYCLDRQVCSYQKIYNNLVEKSETELFLKCPSCNGLAIRVSNSFSYDLSKQLYNDSNIFRKK